MARTILGIFDASADWDDGAESKRDPSTATRATAARWEEKSASLRSGSQCGAINPVAWLLQALRSGIVAEQIFENGQDVLAILDDAFQNRTKLGLAFGFAIPLREHRGGDADVAAQFVGGMAAQEKPVEKRGFALRELEVLQSLVERVGHSRHGRNRSLQISMSASSRTGA